MPFTQRQRLLLRKWKPLLAAVGVGLLLGFAGPFGTYPNFPIGTRYAFWLGLTVAGVAAVMAADVALPRARVRSAGIRFAAITLLSAIPMTFVVAWTMSLVQPGRTYSPPQLFGLFWGVAAVQLLVAYAATAGARKVEEPEAPERPLPLAEDWAAAASPAFPAALIQRLPPGFGSDIIALETEDHYLRIHGSSGSALMLMRMSDAIALLDPRLGAQVHRRWWVAEAAVEGMMTQGQKLSLCLINKMQVPVGRTFSASARARFAKAGAMRPSARASAGQEPPHVGRA